MTAKRKAESELEAPPQKRIKPNSEQGKSPRNKATLNQLMTFFPRDISELISSYSCYIEGVWIQTTEIPTANATCVAAHGNHIYVLTHFQQKGAWVLDGYRISDGAHIGVFVTGEDECDKSFNQVVMRCDETSILICIFAKTEMMVFLMDKQEFDTHTMSSCLSFPMGCSKDILVTMCLSRDRVNFLLKDESHEHEHWNVQYMLRADFNAFANGEKDCKIDRCRRRSDSPSLVARPSYGILDFWVDAEQQVMFTSTDPRHKEGKFWPRQCQSDIRAVGCANQYFTAIDTLQSRIAVVCHTHSDEKGWKELAECHKHPLHDGDFEEWNPRELICVERNNLSELLVCEVEEDKVKVHVYQ